MFATGLNPYKYNQPHYTAPIWNLQISDCLHSAERSFCSPSSFPVVFTLRQKRCAHVLVRAYRAWALLGRALAGLGPKLCAWATLPVWKMCLQFSRHLHLVMPPEFEKEAVLRACVHLFLWIPVFPKQFTRFTERKQCLHMGLLAPAVGWVWAVGGAWAGLGPPLCPAWEFTH